MPEINMACAIVEVTAPRQTKFQVTAPDRIVQTSTPPLAVEVVTAPKPKFDTQAPNDGPRLLVPIGGPQGPEGPPGPSGGVGAATLTYIDPVQLPDGTRLTFTSPTPYVIGTLAVYLNGLQEHFIIQNTQTTFSFTSAPHSDDVVKISLTQA